MKNWINNIHTVLILELYVRLIKRTVVQLYSSIQHAAVSTRLYLEYRLYELLCKQCRWPWRCCGHGQPQVMRCMLLPLLSHGDRHPGIISPSRKRPREHGAR